MSRVLAAVALAGLLAAVGCNKKTDNPTGAGRSDGHGHDHDDGDKMIEDVGPYHFGLTAHLSEKEGNELDIVIETQDKKNPKPVPLPITKIAAKAKRDGDPKEYDLTFEPDDPKERKDDPPGKCSRFSAKVPWMKPDDKLTVTTTVEVEKKPYTVEWKDFVPKKFAHEHKD
jgi:hypothetical protein